MTFIASASDARKIAYSKLKKTTGFIMTLFGNYGIIMY